MLSTKSRTISSISECSLSILVGRLNLYTYWFYTMNCYFEFREGCVLAFLELSPSLLSGDVEQVQLVEQAFTELRESTITNVST